MYSSVRAGSTYRRGTPRGWPTYPDMTNMANMTDLATSVQTVHVGTSLPV